MAARIVRAEMRGARAEAERMGAELAKRLLAAGRRRDPARSSVDFGLITVDGPLPESARW
jgi:hypothetical protein